MLYADKNTTLLKVPRHTDATIKTLSFTNQFTQGTTSISAAAGDFSVEYTVPFYYAVKLLKELPLKKGTYTYKLMDQGGNVYETGTLQFDIQQ